MGADFVHKLELLPVLLPVLILSLVLHELAHAYVGTWLGDRTPREQGRLTLNPIPHLDPWGSAIFLFTFLFTPIPFGWARPVMVDTRNLKHPQRDMAIVAVAGPLVNFLIALGVLAAVVHAFDPRSLGTYMAEVINTTFMVNVILGVFNLLPIPPLDGSRIVGAFMPRQMYEDWSKLDAYAPIFIIVLLLFLREPLNALLGDASGRVTQAMVWIVTGGGNF